MGERLARDWREIGERLARSSGVRSHPNSFKPVENSSRESILLPFQSICLKVLPRPLMVLAPRLSNCALTFAATSDIL